MEHYIPDTRPIRKSLPLKKFQVTLAETVGWHVWGVRGFHCKQKRRLEGSCSTLWLSMIYRKLQNKYPGGLNHLDDHHIPLVLQEGPKLWEHTTREARAPCSRTCCWDHQQFVGVEALKHSLYTNPPPSRT